MGDDDDDDEDDNDDDDDDYVNSDNIPRDSMPVVISSQVDADDEDIVVDAGIYVALQTIRNRIWNTIHLVIWYYQSLCHVCITIFPTGEIVEPIVFRTHMHLYAVKVIHVKEFWQRLR